MTLKEIIDSRGSEYDDDILDRVSMANYVAGYRMGWKEAYEDIKTILEKNGFDTEQTVIKENKNV